MRQPLETQHALLLNLRAGGFGAAQKHAVQVEARIDHQRPAQLHFEAARFGRGEHGVGYKLFRGIVFDQVRILGVGLIGHPAAAGFFPRQFFVEDNRAQAGTRQAFRRRCAGRSASENSDCLHLVSSLTP
jgi:hypothetical protein